MMSKEYVDESEERILNDDYKNWKKSVAFLYDMVMTHALHWPSFTFEWLPSTVRNGTVVKSRLLLGSTTDTDRSHVLLADVYLPSENDLDPDTPFGTFKPGVGKIELQKRLIHSHAVTRARHMPQKPQIIATTSNNCINIYDTENRTYGITEEETEEFATIPDVFTKPLFKLGGFSSVSGILSWNLTEAGCVLGAGDSKTIGMWDLLSESMIDNYQNVTTVFDGHTGLVTDVSWWSTLPTVFLSSSSDCTVGIWDIRSRNTSKPSHSINGHKMNITSVAGSPFSQFVFASTSDDGTLALWDIRNISVKLHSLSTQHNDALSNIRWSPHSSNMLACSTSSRVVCLWNLDVLHDTEKLQNATEDDPPELMFMHGGHSAAISDLGWHPDVRNIIGSTANDNIIQIWKPIESIISSVSSRESLNNQQSIVSQPNQTQTTTITTAPMQSEGHHNHHHHQ